MSTAEYLATYAVFGAYFGLPAALLAVALLRRQLATDDVATGRHHPGALRAARRRTGSAWATARRAVSRRWRRRTAQVAAWAAAYNQAAAAAGPAAVQLATGTHHGAVTA